MTAVRRWPSLRYSGPLPGAGAMRWGGDGRLRGALHHDFAPTQIEPRVISRRIRGCDMADHTTIQINVDTFSEGDGFFVRTEIDARSVSIRGPFPDLQSAQRLKAEQLASREKVSEALKEHLRHATSAMPGSTARS